MTPEKEPLKKPEQPQTEQYLSSIVQALETIAIAVAALPGQQLLIPPNSENPVANLTVSSEGNLTAVFKRLKPENEDLSQLQAGTELRGTDIAPAPLKPTAKAVSRQKEASSKELEENVRVNLKGRLGAEPYYKTTTQQKLVARFPLAVPNPEDTQKPIWETILAFGKTVQQMQQDNIHKGQNVTVVGYKHERDQKLAGGKTKKVQEVYAVIVKPVDKPGGKK